MNRVLILMTILSSGTAFARPIGVHNEVRRVAPRPTISHVVNSHVLFLNDCLPSGCTVRVGDTDSRVDTSELASATSNISGWPYSTAAWNSVVSCVTQTMAPFNLKVTDTDPGTAEHFEVMVGGNSAQLKTNPALDSNVGGVAPLPCTDLGVCAYIPNALVFDFPQIWGQGSQCNSDCVLDICATASQEIAHAWTLDHVVDGSDPMSYNLQYSPVQPSFHNNETCGSDCIGGQSPLQLTCSSSNDQTATHTCFSTDAATQDELTTILALFGPSDAVPPSLSITSPSNGATVQAGFAVKANCTASDGVAQVQLVIDNVTIASLTAAPFDFTAPPSLANGTHTVDVNCTTTNQATGTATINVTQGAACKSSADCMPTTDICLDGSCIAGSGAPGGLGATCTKSSDCDSGQCATGSSGSFCVIPCDPTASSSCPSSFGCVMAGASSVCFPGADDGGGGCNSNRSSGGTIVFGLGFAALLLVRRRGGV